MKLIVFHMVLIGSAILFLFGYGAYETFVYLRGPEPEGETAVERTLETGATAGIESLLIGLFMIAVAVALTVYLVRLIRRYRGRLAGF
jgi:hypothetical protein